jgi:hypothetical protein
MLYSIIANFVMVARRVLYCEFRHGCKSGSCVTSIHVALKFASICVASIMIIIVHGSI